MRHALRWLGGLILACIAAAGKALRMGRGEARRASAPQQREGRRASKKAEEGNVASRPVYPSPSLQVSPSSSNPSPPPLRNRGTLLGVILTIALATVVIGNLLLRSPPRPPEDPRWHMPDADPALGRLAVITYGCGGCHLIPGIQGATGRVGPQLTQLRAQTYIAGVLPNLPENLALWILNPQAVNPDTAMPALPVTESESRHIAAYLYSVP